MAAGGTRLYLITPPRFALEGFASELAHTLDAADIAAVQLRMKDVGDGPILAAAERLMPIVHQYRAAFIVNDRPDLAKRCGADGVHIGQDDMPYAQARDLLGPAKTIGVTCHNSRHLAMQAAEAGADYVAFGAMFPTSTKKVSHTATPEIIQWWSELFEVPCVAIGGITVDNASCLIEAGADFLAIAQGVWGHPEGPAAAARQFNQLCRR